MVLVVPVAAQQPADSRTPLAVSRALHTRFRSVKSPTWTTRADSAWVAEFVQAGTNVKAAFTSSGDWIETSTEIGAITMPAAVRTAVLAAYRGFQFIETRRLARIASPLQLFEIHLRRAGEVVWAQYQADGSVFHVRSLTAAQPAAITTVAGTWRGVSQCLPGYPGCVTEQVVYHVAAAPSDTTGFDIQMNKMLAGAESPGGRLACTLVVQQAALYCTGAIGTWHFRTGGDSLVGGLTLLDKREARVVVVRRDP